MTRDEFKDLTFLTIAKQLGLLSTCDRANVGAVIVKHGRCITWGFNGAPAGLLHCEENDHGWVGQEHLLGDFFDISTVEADPRRAAIWREQMIFKDGCRNVTHAEANTLAYAARQGISTEGGTLYVSLAPCLVCARLLIAAGIVRVVAAEAYRDRAGTALLEEARVQVEVHG